MKNFYHTPGKKGRHQKTGNDGTSKHGLSIAYINIAKITEAPAELYEEDEEGMPDTYRASLFVSGSEQFLNNPIPAILSEEDEQKLFDAYY